MYTEYSDPDAVALQRQVNSAVAGNTFEARQAHRDNIISLSHVKACLAAKIDPALGAEDVAKAKAYVRARSFAMLHKAWNVIETVLDDPQGDIKLGTKLSTALEVITRAVGRPEVPNAVKADLSQMSPVDAIDLLMQELAAGNIDERYASVQIDLLRAKIDAQKLEQLKTKTINGSAVPSPAATIIAPVTAGVINSIPVPT